MFGRRRVATLVAEFLGTGVLTLLILSVQRSTIGVPFFVAAAAGLTLAYLVFSHGSHVGGFFNPAVTLGLWTARKLETISALLYIVVQLLGAWGAYYLYTYFVNNDVQAVGGDYSGRILVAETVGAVILSMGIMAALTQGLTRAASAAYAGVAYMVGMVAASSAAIGLLNPAVALGVNAWEWGTYVLGPVLGAVIGVNLYNLLFVETDESVARAAAPAPVAIKKTNLKKSAVVRKKATRAKR